MRGRQIKERICASRLYKREYTECSNCPRQDTLFQLFACIWITLIEVLWITVEGICLKWPRPGPECAQMKASYSFWDRRHKDMVSRHILIKPKKVLKIQWSVYRQKPNSRLNDLPTKFSRLTLKQFMSWQWFGGHPPPPPPSTPSEKKKKTY